MKRRVLILVAVIGILLPAFLPVDTAQAAVQTVCGQFKSFRWSAAPADWAPSLVLCGSSSAVVWGEDFDDDFSFDWRVSPWPLEGQYGRIFDADLVDLGNGNYGLRSYSRWEYISNCVACAQPAQISFTVDRDTITRGECTTLRWDVENAQAIYLDNQGVTGHESRQICPSATTTYTLRVVATAGDEYRSITVTVRQPSVDNASLLSCANPTTPLDPGLVVALACKMRNTGNTTWGSDYQWILTGGNPLGAPRSKSLPRAVPPGQDITIDLRLTVPSQPGTYTSTWRLADRSGHAFGDTATISLTVRQLTPARVVLEDFTIWNKALDRDTAFKLMHVPSLWEYNTLWLKIQNVGEQPFQAQRTADYTIAVALREKGTGKVLEFYEYHSAEVESLTQLNILGPGETIAQTPFISHLVFYHPADGELEVTLVPDAGLAQDVSSKVKPILIKAPVAEVLDCAATVVDSVISLLPPAKAGKAGMVVLCMAAAAAPLPKAEVLAPKMASCLLNLVIPDMRSADAQQMAEAAQTLIGVIPEMSQPPACEVLTELAVAHLQLLIPRGHPMWN